MSMANSFSAGMGGECRLEGMLAPGCSNDQLYKLFDIAPGLESLDYDRNTGELLFTVTNTMYQYWFILIGKNSVTLFKVALLFKIH